MRPTTKSTPDLCDENPDEVQILNLPFLNFGKKTEFYGEVITIRCFEDNCKVKSMLGEKGIDGVIEFRAILKHLISMVDKHKNYEKSDLLQILRILKSYNLFKGNQMELFEKKRSRKNRKKDTG